MEEMSELPVDLSQRLETASVVSGYSTATASLMEPPSYHVPLHSPLMDVFHSHHEPVPQPPSIRESNSEAMIRALKALQDKIRGLELERASASRRFQQVASSTQENDVLRKRLDSVDTRFALQKQELAIMKERLQQSELEKKEALERTQRMERKQRELLAAQQRRIEEQQQQMRRDVYPPSPEKQSELALQRLQREQSRLRSQQSETAAKLRDVEDQLLDQQRGREASPQHYGRTDPGARPNTSPGKGKSQGAGGHHHKTVPGIHYHLNMKDVPFVVGKSTGPSHSLPSNYQSVLALMKYHSPVLCGAAAANFRRRTVTAIRRKAKQKQQQQKQATPPLLPVEDMQDLLATLEEEFGRLTFEHQELSHLIQEQMDSSNPEVVEDLEKELQQVIDRLENKMKQIEVVKSMIGATEQPSGNKHTVQLQGRRGKASSSTAGEIPQHRALNGVTAVKPRAAKKQPPPHETHRLSSDSGGSRSSSQESLEMLRRMKQIQHTLQRDDLSWN